MATFRPPLNAGSMEPGSTTCRGQRHGVGTGGERGTGGIDRRGGERTRNDKRGVGPRRGGKWRGEEKRQPLVGSAKEYRRFYEGGSANYIRNLQHQEQEERRNGIGTTGNVPGQHGPGHLPGEKMHRRNLHPWVSLIPRRRYGHAKMTPRRGGPILQTITTFRGGGCLRVRSKRHELRGSDGSAAVVHHQMLPRPQRHPDDRSCRRRVQGQTKRHCTSSGGGNLTQTWKTHRTFGGERRLRRRWKRRGWKTWRHTLYQWGADGEGRDGCGA